jgi:hypothetical protein
MFALRSNLFIRSVWLPTCLSLLSCIPLEIVSPFLNLNTLPLLRLSKLLSLVSMPSHFHNAVVVFEVQNC